MKMIFLYTALLIASAFSSLSIADTPNQVLLHYTGTIISKPCDISIGVGSTTTLDMGDLDITTLSVLGKTSQWVNYNIYFSHCDVATNINFYSPATNTWEKKGTFGVFDSDSKDIKDLGLRVVVGTDTDMGSCDIYFPCRATPTQDENPSYTMPIKFRFENLTGKVPKSGKITGIYIMAIEYK